MKYDIRLSFVALVLVTGCGAGNEPMRFWVILLRVWGRQRRGYWPWVDFAY